MKSAIVLHQFPYSHYNEKVRWALDLKRVPHRRRSVLPGPHMAQVRRLTGRTQTPVLVLDDGSRDNDIGIGGTLEMLWVNRFTPNPAEW